MKLCFCRYWVVFSVHDDSIPFLELWTEPTEVASKPPQFMFPLAVCQHISPSLVPAGDHEWTFVVNFETVAIRFSCNSRETMEEWVDCIRNKLGEMGILNPKGNLYSRVPSINPSKTRNPMSPLPQPPSAENRPQSQQQQANQSQLITNPNQGSTNENNNQSFTTSIYLNQSNSNQAVTNNQPSETSVTVAQTSVTVTPQASASAASVSTVSTTTSSGATSSVYLNKSNPTRHVTRIPINKENGEEDKEQENENDTTAKEDDEPYYDAIPDMPASEPKPRIPSVLKKRQQSPSKQPSLPPSQTEKEELARRSSDKAQPQRIKKKSQRSSSLGPLLDEQSPIGTSMANTNSLESIDSNPRQKLPKGDLLRERPHGRIRATGAIPRRPLALSNSQEAAATPANPNIGMYTHTLFLFGYFYLFDALLYAESCSAKLRP